MFQSETIDNRFNYSEHNNMNCDGSDPWSFSYLDSTSTKTILNQIDDEISITKIFRKLNYSGPQFFEIPLPIPIEILQKAYLESLKEIELRPWQTKMGPVDVYLGYSISNNPELQEKTDPLYSSLGTQKSEQFYSVLRGSGDFNFLRNSYYDTYGFRKIHPLIRKHYGLLLDSLNFHLTRSRLSVFRVNSKTIMKPDAGWHIDEFIFQNLRVNIPIFTGPEFFLEIDGQDENKNFLKLRKHLKPGFAYVWNTRIPHRITYEGQPSIDRVHLVLGLMPWFNYNETSDSLVKGKYFGMHPFEIIQNGELFTQRN